MLHTIFQKIYIFPLYFFPKKKLKFDRFNSEWHNVTYLCAFYLKYLARKIQLFINFNISQIIGIIWKKTKFINF